MKNSWKLALVLLVVVVFVWSRGGSERKAPDQNLVRHSNQICKIAKAGIDAPHRGVQKLFAYYGNHAPDMLKQFGDLLVMIERIKDDKAHDRRAALASRRLSSALAKCDDTYERFAEAIEDDPAALRLLEHGFNRLGRTLEILFGGSQGEIPTGIFGLQQLVEKTSTL